MLAPSRAIVDEELAALRGADLGLEVEYAQTAIRAAVSAAQDERPEMELLLVHARDLTERLIARGRRPIWPRPFNLLAGELWLEVDRYEEALGCIRAGGGGRQQPSCVGLGWHCSYSRLGNQPAACAAYQKVRDVPPLREEAMAFLTGCP